MRKLIAACILLWALHLSAGTTTLTGIIRDEQGNPLNGTLVMRLPVPAQDPNTNTAIAPTPVTFQLINGQVTGGAPLYDLATIQPNKLWYAARGYDTAGRLAYYGNFYVTGATFNIGTATPVTVTTSNIVFANPFITNANNTVTGNNTFSGTNTFTGSNTFSGNNTLSGNNTFSGTNTFTKSIVGAALNGIVYVDGTTYTTVQNAINALPANGGTVIVPCGTYAAPATIPAGTHIRADCPITDSVAQIYDGSAQLNWAKFTSSGPITYGTGGGASQERDVSIDGIVFDFGGNGGLTFNGISWSSFKIAIINCGTTNPCLTLQNSGGNTFEALFTYGGSESIKFTAAGTGTGFFSTINAFMGYTLLAQPASTFVDFAQWSDSNFFNQVQMFCLGCNATLVGINFNSASPNTNVGIYNEKFKSLDFTVGGTIGAGSTTITNGYAEGNEVNIGTLAIGTPMVSAGGVATVTRSSLCNATSNCSLLLRSRDAADTTQGLEATVGFRSIRVGATTATAASAGAQATTTYSWNNPPWTDTNYSVVCTGLGAPSSGVPSILDVESVSTTQFTVRTAAITAAAASFAGLTCIGRHDTNPNY